MDSMTGKQIEAAFGFPGLVEFEGKWYEADRIGALKDGDIFWNESLKTATLATKFTVSVWLILRPVSVPPKPTQEWLDAHAPEGYTAKCGEKPITRGYAGVFAWRSTRLLETPADCEISEGCWFWPVILTKKEATYPGINPQNLPPDAPKPLTLADLESRVASLEAWRKADLELVKRLMEGDKSPSECMNETRKYLEQEAKR